MEMNLRMAIALVPALSLLFAVQARALLVWGEPSGIVVSENAPEPEQMAAKEFQRLYKLRTGVELRIHHKDRENGVYIGRTTLQENPPARVSSRGTVIQGQDLEHYIQSSLDFNFDELDSGGFAYMTAGWTSTFRLLIAGKTPEDSISAVYHFCEKHLGLRRTESSEFKVAEEKLKDFGPLKYVAGQPPKEGAGAQPKPADKPAPQATPKVPSES